MLSFLYVTQFYVTNLLPYTYNIVILLWITFKIVCHEKIWIHFGIFLINPTG
jgi:hypothetical protein